MDLRHQSSAMCIIMLGGEDTHPWSATNVGNPILVTIPVTKIKTNKLLIPATIGWGIFGSNFCVSEKRDRKWIGFEIEFFRF